MRKKGIKITLAILVTLCIYGFLCFIFIPKDIFDVGGDRYYRGKGFVSEPVKDAFDIIVFGHSGVYSGFSPNKLFMEYGYTSYASGAVRQTIGKLNKLLDLSINKQKPNIILLDVDCLYYTAAFPDVFDTIFAPFIFHVRWKTLKGRDFFYSKGPQPEQDLSKGYIFSDRIFETDPMHYMGNENAKPQKIAKRNLKMLNRFIGKCRSHNIEIVLINFANVTSWSYAKHNYIAEYAKKNGLDFLDMNIANDEYRVHFDTDFRDNGNHYNVYGAERATMYLGEYLRTNFGAILLDKREDATFAYWQKAVQYYQQLFKNANLPDPRGIV